MMTRKQTPLKALWERYDYLAPNPPVKVKSAITS
jgi:hypothetical protein